MSVIFISDLHLSAKTQANIDLRFFHLLNEIANPNNTLYILGDLFDVWLRDSINMPQYATVINQLKSASKKGLKIFLLVGNRDFMLGNKFYWTTKITPIKDVTRLNLNGQKILLTHGDKLCIDDKNYQIMRLILQNPIVKFVLKIIPKNWLLKFVNKLRIATNTDKDNKPAMIMDVNNQAVEQLMHQHHCDILIHGHTHRPAVHSQRSGIRYVLGDWQNNCQILYYDDDFELVKL